MMEKRVLVTGGAGFLGSHLCERLLAQGHEVLCVDNFFTGAKRNIAHLMKNPYFELLRHDVTFPLYVEVDEIYNLACPASPVHYQWDAVQTVKTSVHGAINMLGLAKRLRVKILQASTSEVYGDPQVHPQTEDYWGHVNPIGPRACYDEGKRCAETLFFSYHRQHGIPIKVVRIFNSILANERICAFNDGQMYLTTAQDYAQLLKYKKVWHPTMIEVPAFDPQTGRIQLRRVSAFIEYPSRDKDAYQITTRYGRQIRVTGDHSLFKRDERGHPVAVPVRELQVGDSIAIPSKLPVVERDTTEFHLGEHFIQHAADDEALWDWAVVSPALSQIIEEQKELIHQILMRSSRFDGSRRKRNTVGGAYRKYRKHGCLPLYVVAQLQQRMPFKWPAEAMLRPYTAGKSSAIPNRIVVTDDLLWLLGFFLAEGRCPNRGTGTYGIKLHSEVRFLKKAKAILERSFGVRVGYVPPRKGQAPELYVHSKLLGYTFKYVFGIGELSHERRIPSWIFQLPLSRLKYFLEGYRQGDGSHTNYPNKRELAFNTVSAELAHDLVYLLLRFGIVASLGRYETTFKRSSGDRKFPFWRITVCEVDNFDILTWDQGVVQKLNAKRWGDLVWARIRSIEPIPATPHVYDFSVPGWENFIAGDGICAHNTYGPRMHPDDGRVVSNFILQALRGEPITVYGDGSQTRSFCYVDDLIEGLIRMMGTPDEITGPINLGNPHETTILELAETVIRLTGSQSKIVYKPLPQDDPVRRRPDITRAKTILQWEPTVPLEEGLQKTIAYYRDLLGL